MWKEYPSLTLARGPGLRTETGQLLYKEAAPWSPSPTHACWVLPTRGEAGHDPYQDHAFGLSSLQSDDPK